MNLLILNFQKKDSLLIYWDRHKKQVLSFNKKNKTYKEITSLDEVKPGKYKKTILVLGRNLYVFKLVQLPKLKKALLDKAIATNIGEWSPFQESQYFFHTYTRDGKTMVLLTIFNQEDYDEIINQIHSKGIKPHTVIPESFCYLPFFEENEKTVGVIQKETGVELLHFDVGMKESQYIPIQKWDENAFDYFIKSLGPEGLEIKKILWMGSDQSDNFSFPEDYSVEHIKSKNETYVILEGSEYFSASIIKNFGKSRISLLDEEDRKYLKPASLIVFSGIFLFYLSVFYTSSRKINVLNNELSDLREQTVGMDEKINRIDFLKGKVEFIYDNFEKLPSQLFILSELQKYLPDLARLTRYTFSQNRLEVSGICPQASEFISRLNSSGFISNINLKSPIEKDRVSGDERFTIEIIIKK